MTPLKPLLPWQQKNWEHLYYYIAQKRVPQALLITGKKGLGKQQLAHQFACALLCANPQADGLACGHCNSCLLLSAETHPDYIRIKPDETRTSITVAQIRSLINELTLKPQFDTHRVVIISSADLMNIQAANAFLKCLEEPNERTVIILITDRPAKLPATILSRCQKLAVSIPDKSTVFTWLKQQAIHDDQEVLSGLAQGAPLLALQYANESALKLRNECFKEWMNIAKQQNSPVIIAEAWYKLTDSPIIFWMTSWIIDLIKYYYQARPDSLYNPDLNEPLQVLSQHLELKGLYKLYDLLLKARQNLSTQINKQLMFEEILIQWAELNRNK